MVYKEPAKTIWVRLGPISVTVPVDSQVPPFQVIEKTNLSGANGLGLTCFLRAHPQAGWHQRASPALSVCFLSLPGDTCWSRVDRCDASSRGSSVGVRPSLPAWFPPCAERCASPPR